MRKSGIDSMTISVCYISIGEFLSLTVHRLHEGRMDTVVGHATHSACAAILQCLTPPFERSGARCVGQYR